MTPELHLTDEQLSALADGSISEIDRGLLVEHLRACDICHETYREAVRYRAIWAADPSVFRAPDELVRLALHVARKRDRRSIESASRARVARFQPRWLAGLAAAGLVVTAVVLWRMGIGLGGDDYDRWFQPLQQAVESASAEGSIVLPGAEQAVAVTSPQYRSGFVAPDDAIAAALDGLTRAYRNGPASADVAYWLISGYLATGEVEHASVYARDARLRFPGDARFLVCDAIIAYRSNEMVRAERLLRTVPDDDPHNGVALLNLALVQYEMGRWDSARQTLERVRSRFAGSPLEARASTLISDLLNG